MAAAFRESQRTEKAVQPTAAAGGGQAEEELDIFCRPCLVRNCAREQGPIATGCSCLEMTSAVLPYPIDHAVWVPAPSARLRTEAGTTWESRGNIGINARVAS